MVTWAMDDVIACHYDPKGIFCAKSVAESKLKISKENQWRFIY
jgi:hypothetical protein